MALSDAVLMSFRWRHGRPDRSLDARLFFGPQMRRLQQVPLIKHASDNCPAHKTLVEFTRIKIVRLLPNGTGYLQVSYSHLFVSSTTF